MRKKELAAAPDNVTLVGEGRVTYIASFFETDLH
jgi:hypothetical protein